MRPEAEGPFTTGTRVTHEGWGAGNVGAVENGQITVVFDSVGYKTLVADVASDRGLPTVVAD